MLYLFNTNIVPGEAIVRVTEITAEKARAIVGLTFERGAAPVSAIGHEASAMALSAILGVDVAVNRANVQPEPFDKAISLKLNGRLEEGVILDSAAMEKMGYTLFLLEFYPTNYGIAPLDTIDSLNIY